jgi:thioredoxin-related protein
MKKLFIMGLLLSLLGIVFFARIENGLIDTNFSWTFSKILPYTLLIIGGLFMFVGKVFSISFLKFLTPKSKYIKWTINLCLLLAPFSIGFALHPIYEGDLSSSSGTIDTQLNLKEFKDNDLVVIAIPGCKYCMESIRDLKRIKARKPELKITFLVSSSTKSDVIPYQQEVGDLFQVKLVSDIEKAVQFAEGSFPTFVKLSDGKPSYKWNNSLFGVKAKDLVEQE